jgi:hypothetical protein
MVEWRHFPERIKVRMFPSLKRTPELHLAAVDVLLHARRSLSITAITGRLIAFDFPTSQSSDELFRSVLSELRKRPWVFTFDQTERRWKLAEWIIASYGEPFA